MSYPDAAANDSTELAKLRSRVLALEQELSKSRIECAAARRLEKSFQFFWDRVQDYAFISCDPNACIVNWSSGAERLLGYSAAEVLGQSAGIIFTPEDRANGAFEQEISTALREGSAEDERWHMRQDGSRFYGSGIMTAHRDSEQNVQGFSKILRDLTSRKLSDDLLRESEEQFRLFSENVTDYALIPLDAAGMVSGWNTGAERTFGYSERQILGQPAARFFTPEDVANGEAEKDLRRAVENGRTEDERWMVRQNGTRFWARWVTTPMRDNTGALRGFAKVLRDETERKAAADLLETSLKEKEILLREIHHRVKNNLHVITALVSLQSAKVSDPAVQAVFKELQDRVWAIAALHETLYASPNLSSILFGPYMEQLMRDLLRFHDIGTKQIEVNAESDDVVLSIEQALPLGLILTELASNAFKHAFPHLSNGTIKVALRYLPKTDSDFSLCELVVQDNGLGVPNPGDLLESNSMGLQIVQLLTKQLNGTLHVDQNAGTRICVRFPLNTEPDVAASI